MGLRSLILILTAVLHLVVGGFALRRNPRGSANRALFLLCILFSIWAMMAVVIWHPRCGQWVLSAGRIVHVVSLFCGIGLLHFSLVYPRPFPRIYPAVNGYLWGIGAVIGIFVLFTPLMVVSATMRSSELSAEYGPLKYIYFGYLALCLPSMLAVLVWRLRHSTGLQRLQVAYVLAGCGFTVLLNIPTNMAAPLFGEHSLGWLGPTFTLIFSTIVSHAIVRHRLMGMRVFIGQRIADLAALLISAALLAGVFHVLIRLHAEIHPTLLWVAAIIAGLLFQPIHSRMQIAIGRYFYRPAYDYHEAVLNATRVFAAPLDLDKTRAYLLETINRLLRVEHIRFYVQVRPDGDFLLNASRVAWPDLETAPSQPETITRESPLVHQLLHQQEPLIREEMEMLPKPISADVVAEMAHVQAAVAVPLLSGGSLVAFLLMGPKISGDAFTLQDIDLLMTLAAKAAAAVANAQLNRQATRAEQLAKENALLFRSADEANKAKDRFLAIVSHELRNPLSPILAGVEVLRRVGETDDARVQRALSIIERNAKLQARLVNDLLEMSRVTQGKMRLQWEHVSLDGLVRTVLQSLQEDLARASLRLETSIQEEIWVRGDHDRLHQVVMNLLSNALKFTPPGGNIWVSLSRQQMRRGDEKKEMARLIVRDNGIGIDDALAKRLFTIFQQGETVTGKRAGLGIGLALVKAIVDAHGGQVQVESEGMGKGSCFTVDLPLSTDTAETADFGATILSGEPVRLLLVEDNPDTRAMLTESLQLIGYQVDAAESAEEALKKLAVNRPALILSDINLPGMDGFLFLQRVRTQAEWSTIPAFAITAYGTQMDVQRAYHVGYQRHFAKPVDVAALDRGIRQQLVQHSGGSQNRSSEH